MIVLWEDELTEIHQTELPLFPESRLETYLFDAFIPVFDEEVTSFLRERVVLREPLDILHYVVRFEHVGLSCYSLKRLSWFKFLHARKLQSILLYHTLFLSNVEQQFM